VLNCRHCNAFLDSALNVLNCEMLATRLWELRQKQILTLESFNLSVDQIELMCQKYRDLGQVITSHQRI
jgi:hypothetical protein